MNLLSPFVDLVGRRIVEKEFAACLMYQIISGFLLSEISRICVNMEMSLHVEDLVLNFIQLLSTFIVNRVSILEEAQLNYTFLCTQIS